MEEKGIPVQKQSGSSTKCLLGWLTTWAMTRYYLGRICVQPMSPRLRTGETKANPDMWDPKDPHLSRNHLSKHGFLAFVFVFETPCNISQSVGSQSKRPWSPCFTKPGGVHWRATLGLQATLVAPIDLSLAHGLRALSLCGDWSPKSQCWSTEIGPDHPWLEWFHSPGHLKWTCSDQLLFCCRSVETLEPQAPRKNARSQTMRSSCPASQEKTSYTRSQAIIITSKLSSNAQSILFTCLPGGGGKRANGRNQVTAAWIWCVHDQEN